MLEKRQLQASPRSPICPKGIKPSKRNLVKETCDESIKAPKKTKKTTYFFNPINTLSSSHSSNSPQLQKVLKESDPNSMSSSIQPVQVVGTPTKGRGYDNYDKLVQELQSSDDSFDGIRWRTSPNKLTGSKDSAPLSPLRKVSSPTSNKENLSKYSSTVINEQANSVLSKYGSGFHNILSQTPNISRTRSDMSSSESRSKRTNKFQGSQTSPSLVRAKSNGLDNLLSSKSSSKFTKFGSPQVKRNTPQTPASILNNWINKFDLTHSILGPLTSNKAKDISSNTVEVQTLKTDSKSPTKDVKMNDIQSKTSKAAFNYENIQFSDDFSDSSSTVPSPISKINSNKLKCLELIEHKPQHLRENDSKNPFSDDDDIMITKINTKSTVTKQVTNPQSIRKEFKVFDGSEPKVASKSLDLEQSSAFSRPAENQNKIVIEQDSDDPFSDDDLQFTHIRQSNNAKNIPITLSDQQWPNLKHAAVLRSDIKQFENLPMIPERQIEPDANDAKLSYSRQDLKRLQIKGILEKPYTTSNKKRKQLILDVINDKLEKSKLIVRGEYIQLDFQLNDVIHIIITDPTNPKLIDDTKNLLIWNPDILVSATTVSQQMSCPRKTVLINRFNFPGESSVPLLVGVIIHEIFQACFIEENWSIEFMESALEYEIERNLLQIFSIGPEIDKIRVEIKNQLPYLETWFKSYYRKPLTSNSLIPTNKYNQNVMFSADEALDVEENIWSPMFGIKGMVDVTLEANLRDQSKNGKFLLPMEIKTGKEHISHQAQSSLYSLLFKDRYDMDVISFLLVYTKERITKKFDISPTDLKSLINLRNRITKYLKENTRELPNLIKQSQCDRCEIQQYCMTINKIAENGTADDSGLDKGIYDALTSHLDQNETYKRFYNYWDNLITKEEGIMTKLKKELWKLTANEREQTSGKAIGNLVIRDSDDSDDSQLEFCYTFERICDFQTSNLQNSQLVKYDRVIISDEEGHFAIAQGLITSIRPNFVKVATNRRIINSNLKLVNFNKNNNQAFQGVLHRTQASSSQPSKTFRIDKDEMFHGLGLARYNILNLFLAGGDSRRREIIVDLKAPRYLSTALPHDASTEIFNSDQLKAFNKVLSTQDYSLILGMPGTGKTTVIAELIKFIVQNKKTVLLASYTHSAVDNILLKVKKYGINILRVGSPSKIHKDICTFIPDYDENKKIKNYNDFTNTYMNPPVVATTCLGINDITFNLRSHFDYCIIDEASQVSMPVSLGPLRFCDKFVLVGDFYQLPPLVQHPDPVIRQGLTQSLFRILSDAHPQSVVELTYQYRMCEEIMLLSNILIYNNRLKCGSEKVAKQSLYIPRPEKINSYASSVLDSTSKKDDSWMNLIFEERNKVLFLNHDQVPGIERKVGEKVENEVEAELIRQIVEGLLLCGVKQSDIGVMSLYRSQIRLLTRTLMHHPEIDILTADQFQGRDKECVIISLVRSNKDNIVGDLIKEWRRINVAITRSKSKLIILGSKSTLSNADIISTFIQLLNERNWIYDLPPNADKFYKLPSLIQAGTSNISNHTILNPDSKIIKNNPITKDILNDMIKR